MSFEWNPKRDTRRVRLDDGGSLVTMPIVPVSPLEESASRKPADFDRLVEIAGDGSEFRDVRRAHAVRSDARCYAMAAAGVRPEFGRICWNLSKGGHCRAPRQDSPPAVGGPGNAKYTPLESIREG